MRNVNCLTCGTGSHWWERHGIFRQLRCPVCEGNPNKVGSGRPDWEAHSRWKMIKRLGPRIPGDIELLSQYTE